MDKSLLLFLVVCIGSGYSDVEVDPSSTCKLPDVINVHLVSHTHDDVGWLKTLDEYYYGANNSIQHAGVQYILDSVMDALGKSEPGMLRRFIYVEQAFFSRWWHEQSKATQALVRKYLANGQLEFINGGWCMNDEAATHYAAIIDQMTLGLTFINTEFGEAARPRVGWHIDPFGHSSAMSSLLAMMGFDAFFFGRIDYQDKERRMKESEMEMIWRGTEDLGSLSDIFTGVTYHGYNPPEGFCFDQSCADPPIQDDPRLQNNNVKERVAKFVAAVKNQACSYQSGEIMMTMGSDFQYENAHLWFKNMDKLITYVREWVAENGHNITLQYSTPTRYLDAVHSASAARGIEYKVKTDDFFPYADNPWAYWSGYFTSRPALKRYVRINNNILQACHQLQVLDGKVDATVNCRLLWEAMGVAQHHDAVSGTSKQHVANDYAKRLAIGADAAVRTMGRVLGGWAGASAGGLEFCTRLNISVCPATEKADNGFSLVVYNPQWSARTAVVRVPLAKRASVAVVDHAGKHVVSQLIPVSLAKEATRGARGSAAVELLFAAPLPPMGYATFTVKPVADEDKDRAVWTEPEDVPAEPATFSIANAHGVQATFSRHTGHLVGIGAGDKAMAVEQQFRWYNGSDGNNKNSTQPSGAYILRPNHTADFPINQQGNAASVRILRGPVVSEVYQVFADWAMQTVRVVAGESDFLELEYTIGPIPFEDSLGKEVISRFSSNVQTNGLFYTDSNGRQLLERKRNYRPTWELNLTQPIASNYYPVNTMIGVEDKARKQTFAVLTDRAQGGSSMEDGAVELMVHRRLLHDDYRGVGEPLNETGVFGDGLTITGVHRLASSAFSASATRTPASIAQETFAEPLVFVAETLRNGSQRQPLGGEPIPQVNVLTLQHEINVTDGTFLLRLEHYVSASDGGAPVHLELATFFPGHNITYEELTLSANQLKSSEQRMQWKEAGRDAAGHPKNADQGTTISLNPLDIRTFRIKKK